MFVDMLLLAAAAVLENGANGVQVEAPVLIAAIRENCERIRSGEMRARGTLTIRTVVRGERQMLRPEEELVGVYSESIRCLFDFDADLFRFSRESTPEAAAPPLRTRLHSYVGSKERAIYVDDAGGGQLVAKIRDTGFPESQKGVNVAPVFDPRSIGFAGLLNLQGRYGEVVEYYFSKHEFSASSEGAGIWRLDRPTDVGPPIGGNIRTWWCDEQFGFQPIKYVFRYDHDRGAYAQLATKLPQSVIEESEVTWSKIGEVWLPASVAYHVPTRNRDVRLELEFQWSRVNQSIKANEFDLSALELPSGTIISDYRLPGNNPVILEIIGQSLEQELTPLEHPARGSITRSVLVGLNAFALSALLGYFAKRALSSR